MWRLIKRKLLRRTQENNEVRQAHPRRGRGIVGKFLHRLQRAQAPSEAACGQGQEAFRLWACMHAQLNGLACSHAIQLYRSQLLVDRRTIPTTGRKPYSTCIIFLSQKYDHAQSWSVSSMCVPRFVALTFAPFVLPSLFLPRLLPCFHCGLCVFSLLSSACLFRRCQPARPFFCNQSVDLYLHPNITTRIYIRMFLYINTCIRTMYKSILVSVHMDTKAR